MNPFGLIKTSILVALLLSALVHAVGLGSVMLLVSERFEIRLPDPTLLVSVKQAQQPVVESAALSTPPAPIPLSTESLAAPLMPEPATQSQSLPQAVLAEAVSTLSDADFELSKPNLPAIVTPPQLPAPLPDWPDQAVAVTQWQQNMLTKRAIDWAQQLAKQASDGVETTWREQGREYRAEVTMQPAQDATELNRVVVDISTDLNGQRLSTRLQLKNLAFSNYAQLIDRWDPNVEMYNDVLEGRFHCNTVFNISYGRQVQPVFHGEVTVAAPRVKINRAVGASRRANIFRAGLHTGVRKIHLPARYRPNLEAADLNNAQVTRFAEDAAIQFIADGSFTWHPVDKPEARQQKRFSGSSVYLMADQGVTLQVRGTVNGKVLVYSPKQILITGPLRYASHPAENPQSDDFLGLVSDRSIRVAKPSVTGDGDLTIHAALYAKRRFAVSRYQHNGDNVLEVYGSLSAGTVTATEPRYVTRLRFDERLQALRPPGFPSTDRFELEDWDAQWRRTSI